jgi:hypothetical protein
LETIYDLLAGNLISYLLFIRTSYDVEEEMYYNECENRRKIFQLIGWDVYKCSIQSSSLFAGTEREKRYRGKGFACVLRMATITTLTMNFSGGL